MHEPREGTPETTATSDALDALGRAVATESPQPGIIPRPAAVPHRRGRGRGWWVATAAAVVAVVAGALLVLRDDGTVEQFAGPPSTSLPGPVATDDDLSVKFDPSTTNGGPMEATLVNRSDTRVGLDCLIWRLDRWDGAEWEMRSESAVWSDGGLWLSDGEMVFDCGEAEYLQPGESTTRMLVADDTMEDGTDLDDEARQAPLAAGRYRLVLPASPDPDSSTDNQVRAEARFAVLDDPDAPTTDGVVDCTPVEFAAIANVLGVDSVAADVGISAERCAVVAAPWTVTYELIDAPEPLGSFGATPLDVGDEGYLDTTTDRSGRWSARGAVRVGDRAAILTVGSDATGADTYPPAEGPAVEPIVRDRATTLLGVLAARL